MLKGRDKQQQFPLGELSPEQFLAEYWQKQPCLIRQAIPGYHCPVSPEELAGLACEDTVSSRLVIEKGGSSPWQVKHGPLQEQDFQQLPETHWTLLVQNVDQIHPEVHRLLDYFCFIPNWRIDDVMISYAPESGSVGPHLDSYDVFLLQGMGRREWHINRLDYSTTDFIEGLDLRIIENFQAEETWELVPGDILYLPPGVAHYGIAKEPCLTLSVGFLAPSETELLGSFADDQIIGRGEGRRYMDADLPLQSHCGEITPESLERIRTMMRAQLSDDRQLDHWFGRYISRRQGEEGHLSEDANIDSAVFARHFAESSYLNRSGGIRLAYIIEDDDVFLFIDGEEFRFKRRSLPAIQLLTGNRRLEYNTLQAAGCDQPFMQFLARLYHYGILYTED